LPGSTTEDEDVEDFWTRLEEARARWNVLEHPFYQRWSRGELTREELASYAGEYRHAVVALADAAAATARVAGPELRPALEAHAAEEAAHIPLWDGFARAVGGEVAAAPAPETAECARIWAGADGERSVLGSLVALYAIESGQPAISETKRGGLREHYGIESAEATAYFDLHAELDREHAAAGRALIEPRLSEADVEALLAEAEAVLRANWHLLDGVQRINQAD
jgi:pyrroloquinoline-quinone synthase